MRNLVLVVGVVAACGKDDGEAKRAAPSDNSRKGSEPARAKPSDDEFGVEAAKIVFRYEGQQNGTITAYLENHGKVVALDIKMSSMGGPMEESVSVWKNQKQWVLQTGQPPFTSGFRSKDSELRLISTNDPKQFEMAGYEKGGTEKIAGQTCEIWNQPKTNVWLCRWQGIDLKYKNMGAQTVTAESVELGVEIPKELLDRAGAPHG